MNWHVYLDESGVFQRIPHQNSHIAGFIFKTEERYDLQHCDAFQPLHEALTALSTPTRPYPAAFHSTEQMQFDGKSFHRFLDRIFSTTNEGSLPNTLFRDARCSCQPICLFYTSEEDNEQTLLPPSILNEDCMDLRYENMLAAFIREVLHAAALEKNVAVYFHFPTRDALIADSDVTLWTAYGTRNLFYQRNGTSQLLAVNTADEMLLIVRRELEDLQRMNISVNVAGLDVFSIPYQSYSNQEVNPNKPWAIDDSFFAGNRLADLICSWIRYQYYDPAFATRIEKGATITWYKELNLPRIAEHLNQIFHTTPILHTYGQAYQSFNRIRQNNASPQVELFNLLQARSSASAADVPYISHYMHALSSMKGEGRLLLTNASVRALNDRLFNDYYRKADYETSRKLLEALYEWILERRKNLGIPEDDWHDWQNSFDVVKLLMSCYQHLGDIKKSKQLYDACVRYWLSKNFTQAVDLSIAYVENWDNSFCFNTALECCSDIQSNLQDRIDHVESAHFTASERVELFHSMAKCLSAKGQQYGFLGQLDEGRKAFLRALTYYRDDPGNYAISLLHYLHLLADSLKPDTPADLRTLLCQRLSLHMDNVFGEEAGSHPQSEDDPLPDGSALADPANWARWLDSIDAYAAVPGQKSAVYQLSFFLKALYRYWTVVQPENTAFAAAITDLLFSKAALARFNAFCDGMGSTAGTHPFESIFRSMALLAVKAGQPSITFSAKMEQIGQQNPGTIACICMVGRVECLLARGDTYRNGMYVNDRIALRQALMTISSPLRARNTDFPVAREKIQELLQLCDRLNRRDLSIQDFLNLFHYEYC